MTAQYTVKIASSIYMDSDGVFSKTATAGVPVIPSREFTLPVDPAKVASALTAISDTVKKYTSSQNTESLLLRRIGIAGEALKMLKDFGALTGQLAKFVPYVAAAVEVLKAFNILSDGSDAVSPAMQQRFDQLNALIIAHQKQWAEVTSAGYQNKVLTSLDSVSRYAEQTRVWEDVQASQIPWSVLDTERTLHKTYSLQEAHADLLTFLNPSLWYSQRPGRDPEDPEHTFDPLRPLFLSLPDENDVWHPAPGEHTGYASSFDHRMMVHVVPSLVGSYLTMIQTLLPEYRSVGTYRTKLLALATQIEELLDLMRTLNLARTDYSGFDLSDDFDGVIPGMGHVRVPKRFDIGAYDLAASRHLPYGWTEWPQTGWWDNSANVVDVGALTFNWPVPDLDAAGRRAALEAETAIRYGTLLYSSGYLQLAQTAALLRHLSVAPDESETVAAGFRDARGPVESTTQVTVTSRPVFPFPQITAQAERSASQVTVDAVIRTQSPVNCLLDPIPYRVYLRTLRARTLDCRSDYSDVYWTTRDHGDQNREPSLKCHYTEAILDERRIVDGVTPRTVEKSDGTLDVELVADVFELWAPYPDTLSGEFVGTVDKAVTSAVVTAAGTSVPSRYTSTVDEIVSRRLGLDVEDLTPPAQGDPSPVGSPTDGELGSPSVREHRGQRRHLKTGQRVEIAVSYVWDGARLDLHLETASTSPNFDVYLVVEERIVRDQWRHSSYLLPFAPRITRVPQSFLDQEAELAKRAHDFWSDLNRKYAESQEIGPGDPIVQLAIESIRTAEQRAVTEHLYRERAPDHLARALRDAGLEDHR